MTMNRLIEQERGRIERTAKTAFWLKKTQFRRNLRRLRLSEGFSFKDVAQLTGVSKTHVWDLESGRADNPSLFVLTRFAALYRVSIENLLEGGGK